MQPNARSILPRRPLLPILALLLAWPGRPARAAVDCPEAPGSNRQRRELASDWFARAERAEATGRDRAAITAYTCSFRLVPHPFTAYNLARVAEGLGELELALQHYRAYLERQKNATDRQAIEERIKRLQVRVEARAAVQGAVEEPAIASATPAPAIEAPAPAVETPTTPADGPGVARQGPPAAALRHPDQRDRAPARRPLMDVTTWALTAGGLAALGTGVAFNLEARRATDICRDHLGQGAVRAARAACDRGRYFAHRGYLLFGLAGLAAVVDAGILIHRGRAGRAVRVSPLPDGAALMAGTRF